MISYAQNGEDVLLQRAFGNLLQGFYVDVGAFHPAIGSVTKTFYDRGWTGVNVEPGPGYDLFIEQRARDCNLRLLVSDRDGDADFWFHEGDPGSSTMLAAPPEAVVARAGKRRHSRVRTMSLRTLMDMHAMPRHVHFLKIDAEGAEGAIVAGGDWTRHRPEMLVIESSLPYSNIRPDAEWHGVLRSSGYLFGYFDGLNDFYVREESRHLTEVFRVPINVLDAVVPSDSILAVHENRRRIAEAAWASADAECHRLRLELASQRSARQALVKKPASAFAGPDASPRVHHRLADAFAALLRRR